MIFKELLQWLLREHDMCKMFYAFGLNLADTSINDYIGPKEIGKIRQEVETRLKDSYELGDLDYRVLCKDKNVATAYLSSHNIKTVKTLALIVGGNFISHDGIEYDIPMLLSKHVFVLKRPNLEASGGFYYCRCTDEHGFRCIYVNDALYSVKDFEDLMKTGIWILQDAIVAHHDLVRIGGEALHTTRIVTVKTHSGVEFVSSFQAFTTSGSKSDSWSNCSVYVGIDSGTGRLKKNGFYSPWMKDITITTTHPDTGVSFNGSHIPFYSDAVRICERAHQLLYANFSVGWDVAITDDGPVIVECNETPGMNAMQCVDKGLRPFFLDLQAEFRDAKC